MNDISLGEGRAPRTDANAAERIAMLHRARFLRPLGAGRSVLIAAEDGAAEDGAAEDGEAAALLAASSVTVLQEPVPAGGADLVLVLEARPAVELLAGLPGLLRAVRHGGVLALTCRVLQGDAGGGELDAALARAFGHVVRYRQRRLVGTLLADARLADSRVVALADPPATTPDVTLLLCSNTALPELAGGVFEAACESAPAPGGAGRRAAATAPPVAPVVSIANPVELPEESLRDEDLLDLRRRAVALVERLVERDERMFDLVAETARLRRRLDEAAAGGGGGGFFDVPRSTHGWPLADNPGMPTDALEYYAHRVDDAAILEGRAGDVFLRRFGLIGNEPDFDAAIAALNEKPRRLHLCGPASDVAAVPDVSIVIPVYGQLGYTLNCLDSLFGHASRRTAEIIVIDDVSPDQTGEKLPAVAGIRTHRQQVNGGFINSCNTGAAMARGRILVMLNNDTRVVAGWLDELVDAFALFPAAGLVGSKLLYPDGSLQEAGGIIWRDGSAWNYGRNDDPNRPQYCHARQVDYVSGASVAVPAALWHRFGGFDRYYAPAYSEDSDLCFRLRAAGHEIWFQPQSRVIHYEGRTSGTDTQVGVKANQVVNAKKFLIRWRDTLADHRPNGEAPYFERERRMHRRALVVDASAPTPDQDAGSVTTVLHLRLLQQLGYKVHFVPQDNFLFQPTYVTNLQREGIECAYVPYDTGFESYIARYGHLFDIVLVFRVVVAEKTVDALRRHAPQAPILFNNMDLHFLRMQREAELTGDAAALAAAEAMKRREIDVIGKVDCTITPSTYEKRMLEAIVPEAPALVLPFMIDFAGTSVGFAPRRDICFLGGYRHGPNIDAVQFFAREVLPLIRAEEPGIRFIIAGAHPTEEVKALAADDVIVTGMVPDLRDVFDATRVFACSVRAGAGVKGKVSAAMSYGLPVVTTSVGAEGMDMQDGEHMLLADEPAAFAAACLRVYRDEALWQRLSSAGQALVQERHSLAAGRQVLMEAIDIGLRHHLGIDAA